MAEDSTGGLSQEATTTLQTQASGDWMQLIESEGATGALRTCERSRFKNWMWGQGRGVKGGFRVCALSDCCRGCCLRG